MVASEQSSSAEQAAKPSGAINSKFEIMAISSYMDREGYQKRMDDLLNAVSSPG